MSRHAKHCVWAGRYCNGGARCRSHRHQTWQEEARAVRRSYRQHSDRPECPSGETLRAVRELARKMVLSNSWGGW